MVALAEWKKAEQRRQFGPGVALANPLGDVIYVDSVNGADGNRGDTKLHPKQTLFGSAGAISIAADGDTIILNKGGTETITAAQTITLNHVRITCPAIRTEQGYLLTQSADADAIKIDGVGVEVFGVRIKHSNATTTNRTGITVLGGDGATSGMLGARAVISNCILNDSGTASKTDYGIKLVGNCEKTVVEYCDFYGCKYGVYITDHASDTADHIMPQIKNCRMFVGASAAFGIICDAANKVLGLEINNVEFMERNGDGTAATAAWDGTDGTNATQGPISLSATCDQFLVMECKAYTALTTAFDRFQAINSGAAGKLINNSAGGAGAFPTGAIAAATFSADAITAAAIAANAITASQIGTSALQSRHFGTGIWKSTTFQAGAINATALGTSAITAAKIGTSAIQSRHIGTGVFKAAAFQNGFITTNAFAAGAVNDAALGTSAITAAKIGTSAIQSRHIGTGAFKATNFQDGTITANTLAANTLSLAKFADGCLDGAKIAANTISVTRICDGAITAAKIAANALSNAKFADGFLTNAKVAANALSAAAFAPDAITRFFGIGVDRTTASVASSLSVALFTVAGGRVQINTLIGEVTSAIANVSCHLKLKFVTTGGLSQNLCASAQISNDVIGTLYGLYGNALTNTLAIGEAALPALTAPIVVGTGSIKSVVTATAGGKVKWHAKYVPLDAGATIVAA